MLALLLSREINVALVCFFLISIATPETLYICACVIRKIMNQIRARVQRRQADRRTQHRPGSTRVVDARPPSSAKDSRLASKSARLECHPPQPFRSQALPHRSPPARGPSVRRGNRRGTCVRRRAREGDRTTTTTTTTTSSPLQGAPWIRNRSKGSS